MDLSRTGMCFIRNRSVPVLPERGQVTEDGIAESEFRFAAEAYKAADGFTEDADPEREKINGLQRKLRSEKDKSKKVLSIQKQADLERVLRLRRITQQVMISSVYQ